MFLGGSSSTRPFGSAVLDGSVFPILYLSLRLRKYRIDLDIEGGGSTSYATFVNKIRSLSSGASKKWVFSHSLLLVWPDLGSRYYVTAAPQCVFPDGALGGVLNSAVFDAIYGKSSNTA